MRNSSRLIHSTANETWKIHGAGPRQRREQAGATRTNQGEQSKHSPLKAQAEPDVNAPEDARTLIEEEGNEPPKEE